MLFTTLPFAAFFLAVFVGHWLLPRPLRRLFLLIASYIFYMQAIPQYGLLIAALTLVNYAFGLALRQRAIEHESHEISRKARKVLSYFRVFRASSCLSCSRPFRRKMLLILAIATNLATLAFFKYAGFLLGAIWPAVVGIHPGATEPALAIILPLGISFFTFEFIHYVVEVYRGQPPIVNPIDFALFAAFFPTQIAGPIKRFPDWVKQLRAPVRLRDVSADRALGLILRGMAKKIIVADMLAPVVADGFSRPDRLGFLATWFVIYAFAAQIYADFSGYTDIGRGCAMLLGYAVPENFASPYQARDPGEFWERWHISLSRWLRDYLYIPLGGSRRRWPRVCLNLLITMALGGLWHGASWHFMLWGVYQGALLIGQRAWTWLVRDGGLRGIARRRADGVSNQYRPLALRHRVLLGQIVTFHLVCLGWVLFRAETGPLAWTLITFALHPMRHNFTAGFLTLAPNALALPVVIMAGAALVVVRGWLGTWLGGWLVAGNSTWAGLTARIAARRAHWEPFLRPAFYLALLLLIAIWPQGAAQRFIYFQF
jgi:alginate O-acetyltransferase complex protein AlgI